MRSFTAALVVVLLCGGVAAGEARQGASQAELRKPFLGSWRLVSIVGGNPAGRGDKPTGIIWYDATGHMAVQIQPDRPRPTWTGTPTPQQVSDAFSGYTAYFGTYTIDERARTVTHHREGRLDGGDVDFVRKYVFTGDRLALTVTGGTGTPTTLTWEKIR